MAEEIDRNFPYGLDRPGRVQTGIGATIGFGVLTLIAVVALKPSLPVAVLLLAFVASAAWTAGHVRTSRGAKVRAADRLLGALDLAGDEDALDVGCGTGLLCAGLAVRLPEGTVTGVDPWAESQLRPTGKAMAKRTLASAGVKGVRLHTGTVRALPLGDASFDLVVSRDVLGLLPGRVARGEAAVELARVLRPGGRVALLEAGHVRQITAELRAAGFEDVAVGPRWWGQTPPVRVVSGRRPARG